MGAPSDRLYTRSHEWVRVDGDIAEIGLTRFAVDKLTDVTFAQMRPVGTTFESGESVGDVESVKTTSDVYAPFGGEVIEVNGAIEGNPGLLNEDPYGKGWLLRARISDRSGLDGCVEASVYEAEMAVD